MAQLPPTPIRFPRSLLDEIERLAKIRGTNRNAFVVDGMTQFVDREGRRLAAKAKGREDVTTRFKGAK